MEPRGPPRPLQTPMLLAVTLLLSHTMTASVGDVRVNLTADHDRVGMGRVVTLTAEARNSDGTPAACLLLPYANGFRWGAHEHADANGRAVFHIPLPNPGPVELQVEARPEPDAPERWIWAETVADHQTLWLQRAFEVPDDLMDAVLWLAVDDSATVYLNGELLGEVGGWSDVKPFADLHGRLRPGANVLSAEARNGSGPAGLLARLELTTPQGTHLVTTDEHWVTFGSQPAEWPAAATGGAPANPLGDPATSLWAGTMTDWPTLRNGRLLFTRTPLEPGAWVSNTISVRVEPRTLHTMVRDPDHLVGMQWEPWFTPHNCNWTTAQAVPVVGKFWSWDPDALRQHMIWLMESGIDFLIVDWTNHLWGKSHWDERDDSPNEIIHCTTLALETLASLRDEGLPAPAVVLYPGLNNGPATITEAINEELDWIYHNYVRNPRFRGLFVEYLGKPLVLIHNGSGPSGLEGQAPVRDDHFTVRWQSSQSDRTRLNESGYWSWMDGSLVPALTTYEGQPEALTVSTAFFSSGGWLAPTAYGRRGGWTYIETFKAALEHRPRFLEIHQFNEFAGQPEGNGYGDEHNVYVDSYSVELSDDIEPVSLTAPAYRGNGGWGFLYLNLTRALIDLYRQARPETTVVAIASPLRKQTVRADSVRAIWNWVGVEPESFSVAANGQTLVTGLEGTEADVDLSAFPDGPVHLVLTANGTRSRYLLSDTEDSLPLEQLVPASASVDFVLERERKR